MVELTRHPSTVLACFAHPRTLDALEDSAEMPIRVAPDEMLLVGLTGARPVTTDQLDLVVDVSAGYTVWSLRGELRLDAFSRLSALKPVAGVSQGLVAQLPAKVINREQEIIIIVSTNQSHHLQKRALAACADLPMALRSRPTARAVA